jgi:hypothetical protein
MVSTPFLWWIGRLLHIYIYIIYVCVFYKLYICIYICVCIINVYKYKQIWLETKTIHPAGWLRWLTFSKPWDFINEAGWWCTYPSEKWWSSSVGIILPNIWKSNPSVPVTTNQQSKGWRMMSTYVDQDYHPLPCWIILILWPI